MTLAVVYVSHPSEIEAKQLATKLVEAKLAACVSILPGVVSIYEWGSKVQIAQEVQLIIKTTLEALPALERMVHSMHPYEVPEFIVHNVDYASKSYFAWIEDTVKSTSQS